jgi:tetratricopeptide (TPR) repeat protein
MRIQTEERIVTANEVTTARELSLRAERALLEQRWDDAASALSLLVSAEPQSPNVPEWLMNLATAYEQAGARDKARSAVKRVYEEFPSAPQARPALLRAATLHAYLEEWPALEAIGDRILARSDVDDVDRIMGLGSRGLGRVEQGRDLLASPDILDGLDLADRTHYAAGNVLPVAVAHLRFALAEIRRVQSERIKFVPVPDNFLDKLERRSTLLLQAQASYADTVRSVDPHWAAMAGYRVGEMYRNYHRDVADIPAPAQAKTEKQKQIFYAFMHIRYRNLLLKGITQLEQTIALGERIGDKSSWIERAKTAKVEMDKAIAEEKETIAKFPFTEEHVQKALEELLAREQKKKGA